MTADDLRQLEVAWTAQWRRPPTPEEMRGLVEARVREEILYREALALGLDRGDAIVKRRLAQKMEFLAERCLDAAAIQLQRNCARGTQATRTALPSLGADRSGTCTSPRTVAGRQARVDATHALRQLSGKPADTPVSRQRRRSLHVPKSVCRSLTRANRLDIRKRVRCRSRSGSTQAPGRGPSSRAWVGISCSYSSVTPGRVPSYDEIEPQIKAAWLDEQRAAARQRAFEAMKAHYEIRSPRSAAYCDCSGCVHREIDTVTVVAATLSMHRAAPRHRRCRDRCSSPGRDSARSAPGVPRTDRDTA